MKNTIFNKFPKQPYTIYNVVRCLIAWFTFVGTSNWYQGIDNPTLWQRLYKWRISPKTAWTLASGSVSFPKGRPKCCGREMYPCGGILGKRPDGKVGDVEHFWRCDICKSEVVDLLS